MAKRFSYPNAFDCGNRQPYTFPVEYFPRSYGGLFSLTRTGLGVAAGCRYFPGDPTRAADSRISYSLPVFKGYQGNRRTDWIRPDHGGGILPRRQPAFSGSPGAVADAGRRINPDICNLRNTDGKDSGTAGAGCRGAYQLQRLPVAPAAACVSQARDHGNAGEAARSWPWSP